MNEKALDSFLQNSIFTFSRLQASLLRFYLRTCRYYITRINTRDTVFRLSKRSAHCASYELGDKDLLEVRRRAADFVLAYVAVVEIAHAGILQDALQALHREIRQFLVYGQLVQVVHRVTRPDPLGLQMIRLYAGLRVDQLRVAAAHLVLSVVSAVLYDARRERSHADLYLTGSLRGQQFHLQSRTFSRCGIT